MQTAANYHCIEDVHVVQAYLELVVKANLGLSGVDLTLLVRMHAQQTRVLFLRILANRSIVNREALLHFIGVFARTEASVYLPLPIRVLLGISIGLILKGVLPASVVLLLQYLLIYVLCLWSLSLYLLCNLLHNDVILTRMRIVEELVISVSFVDDLQFFLSA